MQSLQEEEEAKIHCPLEALATPSTSETPSTSHSDKHLEAMEGLEGLEALVVLADQETMH
jgi:hypothetical protein